MIDLQTAPNACRAEGALPITGIKFLDRSEQHPDEKGASPLMEDPAQVLTSRVWQMIKVGVVHRIAEAIMKTQS